VGLASLRLSHFPDALRGLGVTAERVCFDA
jgi:hypothetical protein